ncbi:MAG: DUF2147 domain-containing protein [Steroidobacteraceae bacterium]
MNNTNGAMRVWMALGWLCLGILMNSPGVHAADDAQTRVLGNWLTEPRDGIIQITQSADGALQGRIVGGNEPGKLDSNNPDPAKRNQVLRGQVIMSGLKYDGDGKWSGGSIYDPKGGSTYKCKIELRADGSLKVRGFIGFALLGKTQMWTRYTGTSMDLPRT